MNLIGSFFLLGMSSFMSSDDSEGRSGWGSGERVPAASFVRSFPSVAARVTPLFGDSPIIVYVMETESPIVFHHRSISVHLEFPGFIGFKSENSRFFSF